MINIGSYSQRTNHGALKLGAANTEWGEIIFKELFWIFGELAARRDHCVKERGSEGFPLRYAVTSLDFTVK